MVRDHHAQTRGQDDIIKWPIILEAVMERLREKLDLPRGHYYLHVAVLAGLPVSLISDLASELERSPAQIAQWITASPGSAVMSIQAGEVFCRLIEILDALLELYDGDLGGALHWLTAPNVVLSNERPVEGVWGATEQKVHLSPAPARKPLWRLVSSGKPRFCRTLSRNGSVR
jgi:uncharacterized protein (DUF2384 family)